MFIRVHAKPAPDFQVAKEVSAVLARRAAHPDPPATLVVSDAVALGVAAMFRGPTTTGQVMESFARTGRIDGAELIEAAQFEQGYATSEGHAALYCLILWARRQVQRSASSAVGAYTA